MDREQMDYYHEMLKRNRLVPIRLGDDLVGLITFYIGGDNTKKYVRENSWSIVEDEPENGHICYIDQLITDKYPTEHSRYSFSVLANFLSYIQCRYPQVDRVRWNRIKGGVRHVFSSSLRK